MLRDHIAARHHLKNVAVGAADIALVLAVDNSGSSGDGTNFDGRPVTAAQDEVIAAGIAINGLAIVRSEPDIAAYYSRIVIGGEAAFITVARNIANFHTAQPEKFVAEIAQIGAQSRSG